MTHVGQDIAGIIGMLLALGLVFVFLYAWSRIERLLDRYRLKYGFDREIESKEVSGSQVSDSGTLNNREKNLNRREKQFKRRVFKD